MTNELQYLNNYFKSKSLHVSDYFVECCLEWVRDQFQTNREDELCEKVYEQWLSVDLRELEIRVLPQRLSKQKQKTIIDGKYAVQVMYFKNIAVSSLSQLKTIRNMYSMTRWVKDEESDYQKSEGRRTLYLNLTDGVEYINAFEYEYINCLSMNMSPGIKLLLTGPLTIRNGEILLKNYNVEVLGGEVEELLVSNAVENILAKELGMPENPNPNQNLFDEMSQNTVRNNTNNGNNFQNGLKNNLLTNIQKPNAGLDDDNDILMAELSVVDSIEENFIQNQINWDEPVIVEDEADIVTNYEQNQNNRHETQAVTNQRNQKKMQNVTNQNNRQESQTVINHKQTQQKPQTVTNYNQKEPQTTINQRNQHESQPFSNSDPKPTTSAADNFAFEDDFVSFDFEDESPTAQITDMLPIEVPSEPYVYIKQLLDNSAHLSGQTFRVKAQFVSVVEKLTFRCQRGWTMKFKITDGSGIIVVDFLSEVLEELIGVSKDEAVVLRQRVLNKVADASQQLNEVNICVCVFILTYFINDSKNCNDTIKRLLLLPSLNSEYLSAFI